MKKGDKVKIVSLEYDYCNIGLKIGDVGEISAGHSYNNGTSSDVFGVKFDKQIPAGTVNLNIDGIYDMFRCQLEVIEGRE